MCSHFSHLALVLSLGIAPALLAQDGFPPLEKAPVLRLESGGAMAQLTAITFGHDGKTLYTAGYDKVIHVWQLQGQEFKPAAPLRVPLGPGIRGVLNALAVSPDGRWLAAAGYSPYRGSAGFREQLSLVLPLARNSLAMQRDIGTIWLFDLSKSPAPVKTLRGHAGPVFALAFAPGKSKGLVSVAREPRDDGSWRGVVRLWQTDTAKEAGTLEDPDLLIDSVNDIPGLALARTAQPDRVHIALAWPGRFTSPPGAERPQRAPGKLLLWQWEDSKAASVKQESRNLVSPNVAALDDASFLTGAYERGGQLRRWRLNENGTALGGTNNVKTWAKEDELFVFPAALSAFASRAGAVPDRVAVGLRRIDATGADQGMSLQLLERKDEGTKALGDEIPLGKGIARLILAGAPGGRHLAVAGHRGQEVHLYSLANPGAGTQILRSTGQRVRQLAWMKKGADTGLELRNKDISLLFDFAASRLLADSEGWKNDAPDADWTVEREIEKAAIVLQVLHKKEKVGKPIRLRPGQQVTATAFLAANRPPLLAVALWEAGEPKLALFDVEQAIMVRQYVGHVQRIHALAFTADGRLLASAADDQTVNVWSLTDLSRKVLGQLGMIPGLSAADIDGKLRVVVPDEAKALARDDIILGLVEAGKLLPLATAENFYFAIAARKPNQNVTIRINRGGKEDVAVPVVQGIDAPRPLFSLFVTADEKPRWLAWSPQGPFDRSDPELEQQLGWHSHTGVEQRPVTFVPLAQHREEYFREGLLKRLVQRGELGAAESDRLNEDRLKKARYTLSVVGPVASGLVQERADAWLTRSPDGLRLFVEITDLPREFEPRVTWKLRGGKEQELVSEGGHRFSVDLSKILRQRGAVDLQVSARATPDAETVDRSITVQFVPLPPVIAFDRDWLEKYFPRGTHVPHLTDADSFTVKAEVFPKREGQTVKVAWRLLGQEPKAPGLKINETFALAEGKRYEVEISAVNEGAGGDAREAAEPQRVIVIRRPRAPVIAVERILPEAAARDAIALSPSKPGEPLVFHRSKVRLSGSVETKVPLVAVTLNGERVAFDREKRNEFTKIVTLEPGKETVVKLEARTRDDAAAPITHWLYYEPELPLAALSEPENPATDGTAPVPVTLIVGLTPPDEAHPFAARLRLNGAAIPAMLNGNSLAGEAKLQPGENAVILTLAIEGVKKASGKPIAREYSFPLYCRRLPTLGKRVSPTEAVVNLRESDFAFQVLAPRDRPPTEVLLNKKLRPGFVLKDEGAVEGRHAWRVTIPGVQLVQGLNPFELLVRNSDGSSKSITFEVDNRKPLPERPTIKITQRPAEVVPDSSATLGFEVRSEVPLKKNRVLVMPQRGAPIPVEGDTILIQEGGKEFHLLRATVRVALERGLNRFIVVAGNDGGDRESEQVPATYQPPAVALRLDRLEVLDEGKKHVLTAMRTGEGTPFGQAQGSHVRLHGEVVWDDPKDSGLNRESRVFAWVNGFREPTTELQQPERDKPRQRKFAIDLRLNDSSSKVILDLPGVPLDGGAREFAIACAAPRKQQRLHLLVIGIDEKDAEVLQERVLKAVQVRTRKGASFTTDVFQDGRIHPPLTGYIKPENILFALRKVRNQIGAMSPRMNDVLVVYFRGKEVLNNSGRFLLSSRWANLPDLRESAISVERISRELNDAFGAQLLLLDVERELRAQPARQDSTGKIGLFDFAWVGKPEIKEAERLLGALRDSLERAAYLGEIRGHIEKHAEGLRKLNPGIMLAGDQRLPTHLERLKISPGTGKNP